MHVYEWCYTRTRLYLLVFKIEKRHVQIKDKVIEECNCNWVKLITNFQVVGSDV